MNEDKKIPFGLGKIFVKIGDNEPVELEPGSIEITRLSDEELKKQSQAFVAKVNEDPDSSNDYLKRVKEKEEEE